MYVCIYIYIYIHTHTDEKTGADERAGEMLANTNNSIASAKLIAIIVYSKRQASRRAKHVLRACKHAMLSSFISELTYIPELPLRLCRSFQP